MLDQIFALIVIGLTAWSVALWLAFGGYVTWLLILEPAWKLWLRFRPVPKVQPLVDLREIT